MPSCFSLPSSILPSSIHPMLWTVGPTRVTFCREVQAWAQGQSRQQDGCRGDSHLAHVRRLKGSGAAAPGEVDSFRGMSKESAAWHWTRGQRGLGGTRKQGCRLVPGSRAWEGGARWS